MILVFDGDCPICLKWVAYIKTVPINKEVVIRPYQELKGNFFEKTSDDFSYAIHLYDEDHACWYSGFSAIAFYLFHSSFRTHRIWWIACRFFPGFRVVSECLYRFFAARRRLLSRLTRYVFSKHLYVSHYDLVIKWILYGVVLTYVISFLSLAYQYPELYSDQGIYSLKRYHQYGLFTWLKSSYLPYLFIIAFITLALLLIGYMNSFLLLLLWGLYWVLTQLGAVFLAYQWDSLLLEVGFLAMLSGYVLKKTARRSFLLIIAYRFLLFRLVFFSGLVKIMSGDERWRSALALTVHYETQPIPNALSWFMHQLPTKLHYIMGVTVLVIELIIPWLIFLTKPMRRFAFFMLNAFFLGIMLTGNYGFFLFLSMVLTLSLLDDDDILAVCRRVNYLPSYHISLFQCVYHRYVVPCLAMVLVCSGLLLEYQRWFQNRETDWLSSLKRYRILSSYGLFAVMTSERYELILMGSRDNKNWYPYVFNWKVQSTQTLPDSLGFFLPRVAWQMWFASLGRYESNQSWLDPILLGIFEKNEAILGLFSHNPFPNSPPYYLKIDRYNYRYTNIEEKMRTGYYWTREKLDVYLPVIRFR